MKNFYISILFIMALIIMLNILPADRVYAQDIVATDHQQYSYDEMQADIAQLVTTYPGIIQTSTIGTTSQGRTISVVTIGNLSAPKHVLITASIHAREYMTSIFVMKEIEYIASTYSTNNTNGILYSELFNNVCFHVIPMINPDGVMISQQGVNGATVQSTKDWLTAQQNAGASLTQFKANANGVDLNRNWPTGFNTPGQGEILKTQPAPDHYPGPAVCSELETQAVKNYITSHNFYAFINYHTQGNIIYYSSPGNTADNQTRALFVARLLNSYNKYHLVNENQAGSNPNGSFGDYVQHTYNRPSVTIEMGTSNPVPASQFNRIFNRNKESWGGLAFATYFGQY